MTHISNPVHIPRSVRNGLSRVPQENRNGIQRIPDFGIFIDTHRDQPHVGSFSTDIHRGTCIPVMVNYSVDDDALENQETGTWLQRHDKHMFITPEAWGEFLVRSMMETGADPRSGDGSLPTSHFRDARKGVYLLKSFRQIVAYNVLKSLGK